MLKKHRYCHRNVNIPGDIVNSAQTPEDQQQEVEKMVAISIGEGNLESLKSRAQNLHASHPGLFFLPIDDFRAMVDDAVAAMTNPSHPFTNAASQIEF